MHHHDERFQQRGEAFGRFVKRVVTTVPACREQHQQYQQQTADDQRQYVLGDGDVQRTAAVGLHYLACVGRFGRGDVKALVFGDAGSVGFEQMLRGEAVPGSVGGADNDRKEDGDVTVAPFGDVPFVGVAYVLEDDFGDVQFLLFGGLFRGGRTGSQSKRQQSQKEYEH